MIPYASRTVDIILHPDCPLPKKGAKDVINLMKTRELSCNIEAVVQISPERYRITFNNARQMNAFSTQDLFIHGKPVEFRSVSPFTWVYISRLSYGIPDEAITRALAPYSGGIKSIKSVAHENIYTGEHNVLMKITTNIPARLRIAGHWCVVKYSGQKQVCFKCHKEGHIIADCPTYQRPNNNTATNSSNTHNTSATNSSANNDITTPSVPAAPSQLPVSYAAVVGRNFPTHTPSESTNRSSTLINTNNNNSDQSASDCAAGAPVSSAPSASSGRGSTADMDASSVSPSSPVRRRGKRRHPPTLSPQPEEKRAVPEDVDTNLAPDLGNEERPSLQSSADPSEHTDARAETVPLPQDSDDDDDDDDNDGTDMDNEQDRNTDEDGDDETDNDTNTNDNAIDDDDDDNDSDEDQMDPEDYLDLREDNYPSDDNASFATVSEAELPTSPAPQMVTLSASTTDTNPRNLRKDESASTVAHAADTLYKLAAVLPTQGGHPSY